VTLIIGLKVYVRRDKDSFLILRPEIRGKALIIERRNNEGMYTHMHTVQGFEPPVFVFLLKFTLYAIHGTSPDALEALA
jgi:hypothetical protein